MLAGVSYDALVAAVVADGANPGNLQDSIQAAAGVVMRWPWQPEQRAEPTNYTDKIVSEILSRASGTAAYPSGLAATEAAVGMFERCIGSATVTPQNPLTAAVTPSVLMLAGRGLAATGNAVFVIEVAGGTVRLAPVAYWNVEGESNPASWRYRCDLAGPSRQRTRVVEASGVVHFKTGCEIARPWMGRSALQIAVATGRLASGVEQSLEREQELLTARIVHTERTGSAVSDHLEIFHVGGIVADGGVDESTPAAALRAPVRIGPEPTETQAELRTDVGRSILSCYGLSPALFEAAGDGSGQREAWRRAWASVFSPIARILAAEIADKLDTPGADLELSELRASDAQGQARALSARAGAVKLLIEAGIDRTRALELAGFDT